jgi:hypothetical protein
MSIFQKIVQKCVLAHSHRISTEYIDHIGKQILPFVSATPKCNGR